MSKPINDLLIHTYDDEFCPDGVDSAVIRIEKRAAEKRKQRLRIRINNSLKSCPFCGGRARIEERERIDGPMHYTVKFVQCTSCHCKTDEQISDGYYGKYCSDEEIANIWNQRKED